jgi:hypothetical protein
MLATWAGSVGEVIVDTGPLVAMLVRSGGQMQIAEISGLSRARMT